MKTMLGERNYGLDLARAMAITLVIIDHSKFFFTPFYPILNSLSVCSYLGVELFFVLSGYLIGTSLLKRFLSDKPFRLSEIFRFWKRRWWRTLPNYFLLLIVLWLVFPPEKADTIKYVFFVQNFNASMPSFFSVSWSLTIEEWFYLILPLLIFCSGIISSNLKVKKLMLFLSISIYLIIFISVRGLSLDEVNSWNIGVRQVLIYRLDAVGYGVLIALLNLVFPIKLYDYRKLIGSIGFVLLLVGIYLYYQILDENMPHWISNNLIFISVSLGFALTIPLLLHLKKPASKRTIWLITQISISSYAMYLVNYDLVLRVVSVSYRSANLLNAIGHWTVYLVVSISLSLIIYTYFERPLLAYRDKTIPKI